MPSAIFHSLGVDFLEKSQSLISSILVIFLENRLFIRPPFIFFFVLCRRLCFCRILLVLYFITYTKDRKKYDTLVIGKYVILIYSN